MLGFSPLVSIAFDCALVLFRKHGRFVAILISWHKTEAFPDIYIWNNTHGTFFDSAGIFFFFKNMAWFHYYENSEPEVSTINFIFIFFSTVFGRNSKVNKRKGKRCHTLLKFLDHPYNFSLPILSSFGYIHDHVIMLMVVVYIRVRVDHVK